MKHIMAQTHIKIELPEVEVALPAMDGLPVITAETQRNEMNPVLDKVSVWVVLVVSIVLSCLIKIISLSLLFRMRHKWWRLWYIMVICSLNMLLFSRLHPLMYKWGFLWYTTVIFLADIYIFHEAFSAFN